MRTLPAIQLVVATLIVGCASALPPEYAEYHACARLRLQSELLPALFGKKDVEALQRNSPRTASGNSRNLKACTEVATKGGGSKAAVEPLRLACQSGDADGCRGLMFVMLRLRTACEEGDQSACADLGAHLEEFTINVKVWYVMNKFRTTEFSLHPPNVTSGEASCTSYVDRIPIELCIFNVWYL